MSASIRISRRAARVLLLSCELAKRVTGSPFDRAVMELTGALAIARPKPLAKASRQKKAAKRETKKGAARDVRGEVMKRAGGFCENLDCVAVFTTFNPAEWDHFFGRARANASPATTWALCRICHRQKTDNKPSAEYWLEQFIRHAGRCPLVAPGIFDAKKRAQARLDSLRLAAQAEALTSTQRNPVFSIPGEGRR